METFDIITNVIKYICAYTIISIACALWIFIIFTIIMIMLLILLSLLSIIIILPSLLSEKVKYYNIKNKIMSNHFKKEEIYYNMKIENNNTIIDID